MNFFRPHLGRTQNTARIVTKIGAGELISGANRPPPTALTGTHGRPCFSLNTGNFNVSAGTLTLRGAGTLNGGIAINMATATTLKLDNSLQVINDRIPTTTRLPSMIASNCAVDRQHHQASSSRNKTMSSLSFDASMSTVTVSQPTSGNSSTTTLALTGNLARGATNRPTGLIRGIDNVNGIAATHRPTRA